jgi:hypothetical protein
MGLGRCDESWQTIEVNTTVDHLATENAKTFVEGLESAKIRAER